MADETVRYDKNNLLEYPDLEPYRHYESENGEEESSREQPSEEQENKEPPHLQTLRDLDTVYALAALLPADLAKIIREVTDALSLDTQGKIIGEVKRVDGGYPPPPITPGGGDVPRTYIFTPGGDDGNGDGDYITDIFSSKPIFKIEVEPTRNVADLSYIAYTQDDIDIKRQQVLIVAVFILPLHAK